MEVEVGRCTCMGLRARFSRETRGGRGSPLYTARLRWGGQLIDMDFSRSSDMMGFMRVRKRMSFATVARTLGPPQCTDGYHNTCDACWTAS